MQERESGWYTAHRDQRALNFGVKKVIYKEFERRDLTYLALLSVQKEMLLNPSV